MKNQPDRQKRNLIIGWIIVAINLYWIWDNLFLMYQYRYSGVLWMFMYPDWVLVLNAVLGLIGVYIGINLIRQRMKIKYAILINGLLFIFGALIKWGIMLWIKYLRCLTGRYMSLPSPHRENFLSKEERLVVGGAACPGSRRGLPPGVTVFANARIK